MREYWDQFSKLDVEIGQLSWLYNIVTEKHPTSGPLIRGKGYWGIGGYACERGAASLLQQIRLDTVHKLIRKPILYFLLNK